MGDFISKEYLYKGKSIGARISDDGKRVMMFKKKSQLFGLLKSWSIETGILLDWINMGAIQVQIYVENPDGSMKVYITSPKFWLENAIVTDQYNKDKDPTAYLNISKFNLLGEKIMV